MSDSWSILKWHQTSRFRHLKGSCYQLLSPKFHVIFFFLPDLLTLLYPVLFTKKGTSNKWFGGRNSYCSNEAMEARSIWSQSTHDIYASSWHDLLLLYVHLLVPCASCMSKILGVRVVFSLQRSTSRCKKRKSEAYPQKNCPMINFQPTYLYLSLA